MKLYHAVRPVVTLAFKMYFKNVYYCGEEKIPLDKPLIVSVNHPTGFFEPTLLACTFWSCDFHFITRGDVFEKPFYRRILEQLNMIPIFRFKDGFANLKNNPATMEFVNQALADKAKIMIFTEGTTQTVKRLRPLQKGFARMAFGSYESHGDLDLHIVPICLTYSDAHEPRSEVYIQVGDAIPLSQYYATHRQNPTRAMNDLTRDTEAAMRPLLIHIEREADDVLVEALLSLYRNTFPQPTFPIFILSKRRLFAQIEIAERINKMPEADKANLSTQLGHYQAALKKHGLKDIAIAQPYHYNIKNTIVLILGFLPSVIGWYAHWLPNAYARKVRNERVKYLEFKGPIQAAVATGATILQYLVLVIAAMIVGKLWFWAFIVLLPFLGFYALQYFELLKKYRACKQLIPISKTELEALSTERARILHIIRSEIPIGKLP